ncbi:catechol 2,3-dioxygenase-like lactoylglutathione lyase family enzyme [Collimonas sp. PA-H2]|uniref:VOC family protein n=1 Tax=Collimonas sp. PA-H2 TaxID=1881062 RepID=UPI000BF55F90|nr:VOC family protein [Collimonas sp. PA-H2]PFH10081.1 catechol 2,3-dioxygenase-like lactoylglutathione lyase family enzyme [Collimonas sp. PA-H2]
MKLDHATIVTTNLEAARNFFRNVAGLTEGKRPPFSIRGYWLYARGRAVIHLVSSCVREQIGRTSPRIDHAAFRMENPAEWEALLERLRVHGVSYQLTEVPSARELQLFVELEPGVVVEFVTALPAPRI